MSDKPLPPFIDNNMGQQRHVCSRWINGAPCGAVAIKHVIWDLETMENGHVCVEHVAEVGTTWRFHAMHDNDPRNCVTGAKYHPELNVCYHELSPYARAAAAALEGQIYINLDIEGLDELKPLPPGFTVNVVIDPKTLRVAPIEGHVEHDGEVEVQTR